MSHIESIMLRLSNERTRLAAAKTDGERTMRKVFVNGIEKELESEIEFLRATEMPIDMSDDDLLAELMS